MGGKQHAYWMYLNNAIGENVIYLPDSYNELILEIERGESNAKYSIHICKNQLSETEVFYKAGQCTTTSNYESVIVLMSSKYVRLYSVHDCGNNIVNNSELRVFYR